MAQSSASKVDCHLDGGQTPKGDRDRLVALIYGPREFMFTTHPVFSRIEALDDACTANFNHGDIIRTLRKFNAITNKSCLMLLIQLLLPDNHLPIIHMPLFGAASTTKAFLKYPSSDDRLPILGSDLDVCFTDLSVIPSLTFRKSGQPIYKQVFCFEDNLIALGMRQVVDLYLKHKIGFPELPRLSKWVHMVPLTTSHQSQYDTNLIVETTRHLYTLLHTFYNHKDLDPDKTLESLFNLTMFVNNELVVGSN